MRNVSCRDVHVVWLSLVNINRTVCFVRYVHTLHYRVLFSRENNPPAGCDAIIQRIDMVSRKFDSKILVVEDCRLYSKHFLISGFDVDTDELSDQ